MHTWVLLALSFQQKPHFYFEQQFILICYSSVLSSFFTCLLSLSWVWEKPFSDVCICICIRILYVICILLYIFHPFLFLHWNWESGSLSLMFARGKHLSDWTMTTWSRVAQYYSTNKIVNKLKIQYHSIKRKVFFKKPENSKFIIFQCLLSKRRSMKALRWIKWPQ